MARFLTTLGLTLALSFAPVSVVAQDRDTLLAMSERVLGHSEALSRLWPGYWPEDQPFILYTPGMGAVFAGALSPTGPTFHPGPLAGAESGFDIDFPSGVPNTLMLQIKDAEDDLSTLFHEQFHDFQEDAFARHGAVGVGYSGEYVDLTLIPDLTTFTVGIELERRVLADALSAPDRQSRRSLAQAYLALRRQRHEGVDPRISASERYREWSEGTAHYVGIQASVLIADRPPSDIRDEFVTGLRSDLLFRDADYGVNIFRWRAYHVGAALAWLLDDFGVPDWRLAVQAGTPLDVLLEQAIGLADPDQRDAVRATYAPDDLRQATAPILERAAATPLDRDSFLASSPWRLVIELDVPGGQPDASRTIFQAPGMTPLPNGAIAMPTAVHLVASGAGMTLEVAERPVLMETVPRSGRLVKRFSILLPDSTALEAFPPGTVEAPLLIEIEGVSLSLPPGAVILSNEGERLIQVSQ